MVEPSQTVAKATALANGLRKNVMLGARRWAAWPRGRESLGRVVAAIDGVRQRVAQAGADAALADAALGDLRAVLEWTTYQSASLAAARTVAGARRARWLARYLGLLDERADALQTLADAESSLLAIVHTRNDYMQALAGQRPHLALPPPLVTPEQLAAPPERPPSRLALIQQLRKNLKVR